MAAALAISLRALLGPFAAGPIHFASPMGVESLFAAAFLAIVLLRSRGRRRARREQQRRFLMRSCCLRWR